MLKSKFTPSPNSRLVWLTLLILGLVTSDTERSVVRADQASDDYKLAIGHYERKRWAFAEEAFQKFLVDHPKHRLSPLGKFYLGLVRVHLKKYTQARTTLEEFTRTYPASKEIPHAQYRIGECSYQLKEFKRAIKEFAAFVKNHPKDPFNEWAWAYLGDAQRQQEDYDSAIVSLKKSLDLFPKGRMADEARFGLAQSYEAKQNLAEALKLYRAIASNVASPRAASAQLQIAGLFYSQSKFPEAAAEYLKIKENFPESKYVPVAHLNAGFAFYQQGDFRKAMTQFEAAETEPTQAITAGYWKGLSLKSLADFSSAAQVLGRVAEAVKKGNPLEESIGYQKADCEFKSGDLESAADSFLSVTQQWPKGRYADHSLYFATECVLDAAAKLVKPSDAKARTEKLAEADLLLSKFEREYPDSQLQLSHRLQRAHFLVLRGQQKDLDSAESIFRDVLKLSSQSQTKGEARYELARLLRTRSFHAAAVNVLKPAADEILKTGKTDIPETLILYSHVLIKTEDYQTAESSSLAYLKHFPNGANADQAWSQVAITRAYQASWAKAYEAISKLLNNHPDSPIVAKSIEQVAEIAWNLKQYSECVRYFTILVKTGPESPFHAKALSDLGWSEYFLENYAAAREHYEQFLKDHPRHELAASCAFQIGDCLRRQKKLDEAVKAFADAFEDYKGYDAMMAGVQAARIYSRQQRIADADKQYRAVADAYPKHKNHPAILSEWALVLADAEQYEQADNVYKRLVKEHPESSFTDNAKYNLADSDLIAGKTDEAKKAFLQLSKDEDSDEIVVEDSLHRLVLIGQSQGDWKSVVTHAKESDQRFPKGEYTYEVRFQLANAYVMLNDHKSAEPLLTKLSQLTDRNAQAAPWFDHIWPLLAESQIQQKAYKRVLATAEDFKKKRPESKLHYQVDEIVGRSWKQQAKFDEARKAFKRVVNSTNGARTATAAKAQLMLAETYFIQKNYKSALNEYTRLVSIYDLPQWQAPALLQEGKCFELLNDRPEAIKSYRELIRRFGDSDYAKQAKSRLDKLSKD